jgi:hypothetical protein
MQFDDLAECEIPHQERRRYSSSFFRSTRSAAALKSSPGVARRSAIAARARSSSARPSRSASWRSRSACAGVRSMVSFMEIGYRGAAPSNNPLQRTGFRRPLSAAFADRHSGVGNELYEEERASLEARPIDARHLRQPKARARRNVA